MEDLRGRHGRRLTGVGDAVKNGAMPVRGWKPVWDASGAAREIRRSPIPDDRLVDEHVTAKVGAVTALAANSRFDEVFTSCDRSRQRQGAQVHARERIGGRSPCGDPFRAQRFEFSAHCGR